MSSIVFWSNFDPPYLHIKAHQIFQILLLSLPPVGEGILKLSGLGFPIIIL